MKTLSSVITLTTDFGTADGYAGAMKGRILTIAPLIGEAVRRIADESSVSSLFD